MTTDFLFVKYTAEDGSTGFVRADQVIAITDCQDRGKRRTAIQTQSLCVFYAQESAEELIGPFCGIE